MIKVKSKKYEYIQNLAIKDLIKKYQEFDANMVISDDLMVVLNGKALKLQDFENTQVNDGDEIILLHSIAGGWCLRNSN